MKKGSIKKTIAFALMGVLSIGSIAYAGSYGGYRLPVYQGNNYWGLASKENGANSCVYNQVDLLTYMIA